MRNLVIVAIWLGIGFAITDLVASYLANSRAGEPLAVNKLYDPRGDVRDLQAAGPESP